MTSRGLRRALGAVCCAGVLAGALGACHDEERRLRERDEANVLTTGPELASPPPDPLPSPPWLGPQPIHAPHLGEQYMNMPWALSEGKRLFGWYNCSGCHARGGGGMGPPLTNQVWVYGKDDDTLFRLIALGSDALKAQGYSRKGSENVVGPMPAMGTIVKSGDDMWKIIAWIRSVNPSSASASAESAPPQ